MAARENQGLQIALIIFVMLTIVLIVTTYLFFSNYRDSQTELKTVKASNAELQTKATAAADESTEYKTLIGAATTDNKQAVSDQAKKDVEKHGKTIPEGKQNYRFLVEFLATELAGANTRIAEVTAEKTELAEKLAADEKAKIEEFAKYDEKLEQLAKEMEDERGKFNKSREEMGANSSQLAKKFEDKRKEHDELVKKSADQISDLSGQNSKLATVLKAINEREAMDIKSNERADGKITWVNQRNRVVWINLGSADYLRTQVSFSVFGSDDANPADAPSKGKIEVVSLLGAHMAEARIVDDDLSKPMMPGDLVFSPAWEPGREEHFALAGMIDVDDDGTDDRQRVRELIALNGGLIDADLSSDGKKTGRMSINTKYLVLGEQPKEGDKSSSISGYTEMMTEAQTLGIRTMPVKEFLNYMGYKPEDRAVNLGKKARPGDFKARLPDGVQRVAPGAPPKDRRRPPAAMKTD